MNDTSRLLAVALLASSTSTVCARHAEWDDRELLELFQTASALTHEARIEEAIDAWDEFVATADLWRAEGRPYGEPLEVHRFHANRSIAIMLDAATGRLETELSRLGRQEAGPIVIAHLSRTEQFLRAYLDQFNWPPSDIPLRVADDPSQEIGAVYLLGSLLLDRGRWHGVLGDVTAAESDWTAARDMLVDAIERMLGHPVDAPGAPSLAHDLRFLTMIAERYLRSVALVDGADAYVEQARLAIGWLPHDDHAVVIQMRSQAEDWARTGTNLDQASALCGFVREVHDEWFDGAFAHLLDNVWAHLVDIAIAIDQGDLERAEALLDALDAIPGLDATDRQRAAELRRRLGSQLSVTSLLDEIYELVDREKAGRPASPPRSTGADPRGRPPTPSAEADGRATVAASPPEPPGAPAPPPPGRSRRGPSARLTVILAAAAAIAGVLAIARAVSGAPHEGNRPVPDGSRRFVLYNPVSRPVATSSLIHLSAAAATPTTEPDVSSRSRADSRHAGHEESKP